MGGIHSKLVPIFIILGLALIGAPKYYWGSGGGFGIGVANRSGSDIPSVTVTFLGHGGTWPIGYASNGGVKGVGNIPGSVPDSADVTWTDIGDQTRL